MGIVAVEDARPVWGEMFHQLVFGLRHTLYRFEAFQMLCPNGRQDTDVGGSEPA